MTLEKVPCDTKWHRMAFVRLSASCLIRVLRFSFPLFFPAHSWVESKGVANLERHQDPSVSLVLRPALASNRPVPRQLPRACCINAERWLVPVPLHLPGRPCAERELPPADERRPRNALLWQLQRVSRRRLGRLPARQSKSTTVGWTNGGW